ncbi:MAG: glycosyltransferase family 4 protein [Chloroflexi bacterium]|nr:glycosyltransferase family 4 protein [Chloroflexota bacterium]
MGHSKMSTVTPSRLRLLMVSAHYFPEMGGVETHVYEVGRRLVQKGIDVTVLTTMPQRTSNRFPRETESDGMTIIRVNAWTHTDLCIAPEMYSVIREGSWDLVHCQGIHTMAAPLAMFAAKRACIPFVLTFHTGGHSSSLRNKVRATQWRMLYPLLASAKHLIGVSRFETDYFRSVLHLPARRFSVIPNGTTLPAVQFSTEKTAHSTLIVSLGRLERYKGHQYMITALPRIREQRPDARLLILGAGSYGSSLRELAQKVGVTEHVEIRAIPAADRQAMSTTLLQASLVALLSEYEAHPIAVMEALSLQRPVLGIHTAGQRELAEQGLIRTIPLHSPPEVIAAAALEQIEQPLIPRHFVLPTWDECAEKLLAVYDSIYPQSRLRAS